MSGAISIQNVEKSRFLSLNRANVIFNGGILVIIITQIAVDFFYFGQDLQENWRKFRSRIPVGLSKYSLLV
jgi:hypothetical protein